MTQDEPEVKLSVTREEVPDPTKGLSTIEQLVDGGNAFGGDNPDTLDFIDERDSWTVNNLAFLEDMTIGQLRTAYKAAGLEMEIRVWQPS